MKTCLKAIVLALIATVVVVVAQQAYACDNCNYDEDEYWCQCYYCGICNPGEYGVCQSGYWPCHQRAVQEYFECIEGFPCEEEIINDLDYGLGGDREFLREIGVIASPACGVIEKA